MPEESTAIPCPWSPEVPPNETAKYDWLELELELEELIHRSDFGMVKVGLCEELPASSNAMTYISWSAHVISYFGVTRSVESDIVAYDDSAPFTYTS